MRDVSHQIDPNATAPVMMVDGLHVTRMRMHKQPSAIQLGHSLPPGFPNNSYSGTDPHDRREPLVPSDVWIRLCCLRLLAQQRAF